MLSCFSFVNLPNQSEQLHIRSRRVYVSHKKMWRRNMRVLRFITETAGRDIGRYIANGNIYSIYIADISEKRHMIEQNGRNGERQGLNKRDLFIRQRIPKLFARAELCAHLQRGKKDHELMRERASELEMVGKKERRSEKATANSPRTWRPFRPPLVSFSSHRPTSRVSSAIYSSYFITRPKEKREHLANFRSFNLPCRRFSVRFR